MDLDAVAHGPTNLSPGPRSGKDPTSASCSECPGSRGWPARPRPPFDKACGSAGLPPWLRQRGPGGRRIGEAAGQQVEGKQLEENGQEEHPARSREDGQRRDGLGEVDEVLA